MGIPRHPDQGGYAGSNGLNRPDARTGFALRTVPGVAARRTEPNGTARFGFHQGIARGAGLYLAREIVHGQIRYFIRESCPKGNRWESRNLFALGQDPATWIHYPGGNAYFIDPSVEDALNAKDLHPSQEDLEEIFLPFFPPEVRRVVERFHAGQLRKPLARVPRSELSRMQEGVHVFDKRRLHFLRYGNANPREIAACPLRLYNRLLRKSRDEIEQMIEPMERDLRPGDHKAYIYSVFYLQRYFRSPLAGRFPQAMDPDRMDEALLEEVCHYQQDPDLFGRDTAPDILHPSLIRYVILYFDSDFRTFRSENTIIEEFIHRHRVHRDPPPRHPQLSLEKACGILGISRESLEGFTPGTLGRHYRKQAMECHPDRGGSHERFIRLTKAYKTLLARMVPSARSKRHA
jgi:hypothetical protein